METEETSPISSLRCVMQSPVLMASAVSDSDSRDTSAMDGAAAAASTTPATGAGAAATAGSLADQTVPDYYQQHREAIMSSSLPSISEAFFNSSYNSTSGDQSTYAPTTNKGNWNQIGVFDQEKHTGQYYTGYEQYQEEMPNCKYHCTNEGSVSLTVL